MVAVLSSNSILRQKWSEYKYELQPENPSFPSVIMDKITLQEAKCLETNNTFLPDILLFTKFSEQKYIW